MPHDKIAELSGNCHARHARGSPIEHNPHEYGQMEKGIEKAAEKERKLLVVIFAQPREPSIEKAAEKERKLLGM